MGRMSKTRKAYRLAQRVKYEDTKPEQVVDKIIHELGWETTKRVIRVEDWVFSPDFVVIPPHQDDNPHWRETYKPITLVEVDGIYHFSPREKKKTAWRDSLLTKAGHRVIHVDAELTKNKAYQTYLKDKLAEAILSPEKVVRIDA